MFKKKVNCCVSNIKHVLDVVLFYVWKRLPVVFAAVLAAYIATLVCLIFGELSEYVSVCQWFVKMALFVDLVICFLFFILEMADVLEGVWYVGIQYQKGWDEKNEKTYICAFLFIVVMNLVINLISVKFITGYLAMVVAISLILILTVAKPMLIHKLHQGFFS